MKLKYIFILSLLCIGFAKAQSIHGGIKAGGNLTSFTGNKTDYNYLVAYNAGGFVRFTLLNRVSFQPEVLYSTQGAKIPVSKQEVNLSYVSVPLVFQLHFLKKFNLEAGPQLSYLVNDNFNTKNINRFDGSVVAGLSFEITDHLFIQGRYLLGLTKIPDGVSIRNELFQASVGYLF